MFSNAWKLSIIVEKLWCEEVCGIIAECGGRGYTILPAGGKGLVHYHPTEDETTLVDDFGEVLILVVLKTEAVANQIAKRIMEEVFSSGPGILYLEDVRVIRSERF